MSKHSLEYLHDNERVGFGVIPWWFKRAIEAGRLLADLPASIYQRAVPLSEVRRLFDSVQIVESELTHVYYDADGKAQYVYDEARKGIVNAATGDVFNICKGAEYVNHGMLIDSVSTIVGGIGDLGVESAGLLDWGARAYLSVGIPQSMHNEASGLDYRPRLLAVNAVDGTSARTWKRCIQLTVCDNTLAVALGEKGQTVKVKNSKNANLKMADAMQALAILVNTGEEFDETLTYLVETEVTDDQRTHWLDVMCAAASESKRAITQADTKRSIFAELFTNDERVAPYRNTLFGLVQADNTYRQHFAIRRGAEGDLSALAQIRAERNMSDVISGKNDDADNYALDVALKVLEAV